MKKRTQINDEDDFYEGLELNNEKKPKVSNCFSCIMFSLDCDCRRPCNHCTIYGRECSGMEDELDEELFGDLLAENSLFQTNEHHLQSKENDTFTTSSNSEENDSSTLSPVNHEEKYTEFGYSEKKPDNTAPSIKIYTPSRSNEDQINPSNFVKEDVTFKRTKGGIIFSSSSEIDKQINLVFSKLKTLKRNVNNTSNPTKSLEQVVINGNSIRINLISEKQKKGKNFKEDLYPIEKYQKYFPSSSQDQQNNVAALLTDSINQDGNPEEHKKLIKNLISEIHQLRLEKQKLESCLPQSNENLGNHIFPNIPKSFLPFFGIKSGSMYFSISFKKNLLDTEYHPYNINCDDISDVLSLYLGFTPPQLKNKPVSYLSLNLSENALKAYSSNILRISKDNVNYAKSYGFIRDIKGNIHATENNMVIYCENKKPSRGFCLIKPIGIIDPKDIMDFSVRFLSLNK